MPDDDEPIGLEVLTSCSNLWGEWEVLASMDNTATLLNGKDRLSGISKIYSGNQVISCFTFTINLPYLRYYFLQVDHSRRALLLLLLLQTSSLWLRGAKATDKVVVVELSASLSIARTSVLSLENPSIAPLDFQIQCWILLHHLSHFKKV